VSNEFTEEVRALGPLRLETYVHPQSLGGELETQEVAA
jgi:hypothetical protein